MTNIQTASVQRVEDNWDVIIIGGGPAGLGAAISACEAGCTKVLVIERDHELGGILQQCIHTGFGLEVFKEDLTGPEYAHRFIQQVRELGIQTLTDTMVLSVVPDRNDSIETKNVVGTEQNERQNGLHVVAMNSNNGMLQLHAKAVVLAMGCRERTRGSLAIPGTRPAGVFTAGTAQRLMNMEGYAVGKRVVILGSGDVGLIMARRMVLEGAQVLAVAEILPKVSGLTRNVVQCLEDYDIPLLLSHTVVRILGKDRVSGVIIAQVDADRKPIPSTEQLFDCDTLLLSVGLIPENELTRATGAQMDVKTGGPVFDKMMMTSIPGLFACGNVAHVHDLVDHVTRESRIAGRSAAMYTLNKGER